MNQKNLKTVVIIALAIAAICAFVVGVRGGWVVGHDYFEVKERREASRQAN